MTPPAISRELTTMNAGRLERNFVASQPSLLSLKDHA
jgi:hypothetical protein